MLAELLKKRAYGKDISGEVTDGLQTNIEDTAEPKDGHRTTPSIVNIDTDISAQEDFPELAPKSNILPSRTMKS